MKALDKQANGTSMTDTKVFQGGRVTIENRPLKVLIQIAFAVSDWQISGGEDWTDKTTFAIEAKPPENVQPPFKLGHTQFTIEDGRLRQTLQALLIDRFQLKFHVETQKGTVYLLERTEKPLKLVPTKTPEKVVAGNEGFCAIGRVGPVSWIISNCTVQQIGNFASSGWIVSHSVLDKTGMDGHFDFRYDVVQGDASRPLDNDSSFVEAIEAMGLKMRRTTGPVETFVIDHAEKPSPN